MKLEVQGRPLTQAHNVLTGQTCIKLSIVSQLCLVAHPLAHI